MTQHEQPYFEGHFPFTIDLENEKLMVQGRTPPVLSWFINHCKYRYNLLINPNVKWDLCSPTERVHELGHHIVPPKD